MTRLWKKSSFKSLKVGGKRDKAERRVVLRGKDRGAIISRAEYIKRVQGAHPSKIAAEHKAGTRRYASAVSEAQAQKQITTRARFSRKGTWPKPNEVTGRHVFLNTSGAEQTAIFKGRDLAVMQTYREDVHGRFDIEGNLIVPGALQIGDGSELAKYRRIKIRDVDDNRVYPETDIKRLRAWWNRKSARARTQFEKDLFQSKELAEAA